MNTQGGETEIPKRGNLTDFVFGVTEENKLQIEIAVKDDARCAIFHNKPFRQDISWIEFDVNECELDFVLGNGEVRNIGMKVNKDISKNMQNSHQILMILMDDVTGEAKEGYYVPLIIHGK